MIALFLYLYLIYSHKIATPNTKQFILKSAGNLLIHKLPIIYSNNYCIIWIKLIALDYCTSLRRSEVQKVGMAV